MPVEFGRASMTPITLLIGHKKVQLLYQMSTTFLRNVHFLVLFMYQTDTFVPQELHARPAACAGKPSSKPMFFNF